MVAILKTKTTKRSHVPLRFPSTRKALWSHASLGGNVTLHFPRISISVTEQALFLAFGQSRSGRVEQGYFCGDINVEPDCSEAVLFLDQFQSDKVNEKGSFSGAIRMSTQLVRNSRHESNLTLDPTFIGNSHMQLVDRSSSGSKVEVAEFLNASAKCTVFAGTNQIHCDVDVDVILPKSTFDLTPIEAVSIATTALSKSVLGTDRHGIANAQRKSGYLTMDQYRKLVFLLESDPKVLSVPIVGVWISGVDLITDPYILTNCIRFMHTTQVRDRVPKPSDPFLLVHKSPLMGSAQFFDCLPMSSSLTFNLLTGSHGFSMAKETSDKRKGLLSVKLEAPDSSCMKRRQFTELIEQASIKNDQENRQITPRVGKTFARNIMEDDSLPRASPVSHTFKKLGNATTPIVPEVSLLDESNPLEAPQPERLALHRVNDSRLNCSPSADRYNPYQRSLNTHTNGGISRKITFDEPEAYTGRRAGQKENGTDGHSTGMPSVCPTKPTNNHPVNKISHTPQRNGPTTLTTAEALHLSFSQDANSPSVAKLTPFSKQPLSTSNSQPRQPHHPTRLPDPNRYPHTATDPRYKFTVHPQPLSAEYHQPFVTFPGSHVPFQAPHTCQCQAQQGYQPVNSLSVITDTVQRLLNSQAAQPTRTLPTDNHNRYINVSPIEPPHPTYPGAAMGSPQTSSEPRSPTVYPVSPEVQQILQQQDDQLKALQRQIQKLLHAHENRQTMASPQKSIKTQTVTTRSATVNTGASLLNFNSYVHQSSHSVVSDTHDSANDSSRSQSLIQHDLTTLDIPTQATVRSFNSDINVDYDSFQESPTGSSKRDRSSNSTSDESWQSPVLGESVSMMAESSQQQETTKKQLDVIIKNVRDLLAKHVPEQNTEEAGDEITNSVDEAVQHIDPEVSQLVNLNKHAANAEDVALATKEQLRKIGIDVPSTSQLACNSATNELPRLQYISMMLSDSVLSDANKSIELNALALKYLKDDQLTELAQLTVHKRITHQKTGENSLLRRVLTIPNERDGISTSVETGILEPNNLSMATQQYLARYALTNAVSSPNKEVSAPRPVNVQERNVVDEESRDNILDIAMLRELPKLL